MSLKILVMNIVFLAASTSCASETASYFRVWQGFKKADLTNEQFQEKLPWFMNETRSLYAGVLSNYLVAIPPINKPVFVPDELALVALRSEADYQQIRATEQGRKYSEAHWLVFNQENSKSAPYSTETPDILVHNQAYDLIGESIDWAQGHTTFFIGLKKPQISSPEFLKWLSVHTQEVAEKLKPQGLKGYIIIANENYEVAYMNWASKEARDGAFASPEGEKVREDSLEKMERLMFQEAKIFDQKNVAHDVFYDTAL